MTAPRLIVPGSTHHISRRCAEGRFFLRPSRKTNQILQYLIAVAVERYAMQLHVAVAMSNHLHLVLTDPRGDLPAFEQFLDSMVARVMNCALGRREDLWGPPTYSATSLETPADIVAAAGYALANPCKAGLVRRGRDWPGTWTDPARIGKPGRRVARPKVFFPEKSTMPAQACLTLVRPPGFASDAAFCEAVLEDLAAREARHALEHPTVLGPALVLAQSVWARPEGPEPKRSQKPRIACGDGEMLRAALQRWKDFRSAYQDAWQAWIAGDRSVAFPAGTYAMRVTHGAPCVGWG